MTVHDDFKGQVAPVTGASSGIAVVSARAFAQAGAGANVLASNDEKARDAANPAPPCTDPAHKPPSNS
jgi:NAD(P)-dependent dehydrogenase (short-subunit alcohol dehydrogenase family)